MRKVNYIRSFPAEYECIQLICNSRKLQTLRQISKVLAFVNTCAPLDSLNVFLNLKKSDAPRNRRQFHVCMADYPYFKPNTISWVFNSYLLKFAPYLGGFRVSFKTYAKFYVSYPALKIWTFHLRVLPFCAFLFANLNGTSSLLYNFRFVSLSM
jgi:hypothetical protein